MIDSWQPRSCELNVMTQTFESDDVVDTSPPGADPNQRIEFSIGGEDDADETGDPQRSCDESWDEFDPEAALECTDEPAHFGLRKIVLEDTSSFECWLQSAL